MTYYAMLDKAVTVKRRGGVSDGMGGFDNSASITVASGVLCRISPKVGMRRDANDQVVFVQTHTLYFLGNQDVKTGDDIEYDGRVFRVHDVGNPSEAGEMLQCQCEEIKIPGS